jgi:hypothetical protein
MHTVHVDLFKKYIGLTDIHKKGRNALEEKPSYFCVTI